MLFYGKFIKVYVCQKLLKYSLVWQTYGKNKTVQFLPHSVYLCIKDTNNKINAHTPNWLPFNI